MASAGAVGVGSVARRSCQRSTLIPGGRAARRCVSDFDPDQLAKGTRVELEHTRDRRLAREIAMDHLAEHPDYYIELEKMERRLKRKARK